METEPEHPLTHASSVETQDTRTTTASSVPDSSETAEVPRSEPAAVRETQSPGRESLYPESQGKFADEQVRSQPQVRLISEVRDTLEEAKAPFLALKHRPQS